jgi:hypothetical protein
MRLEHAGTIVYIAVCLVVGVGYMMLVFPDARPWLSVTWRGQVYAWRLGRARVAPTPAWAALARDDLPAEPRP